MTIRLWADNSFKSVLLFVLSCRPSPAQPPDTQTSPFGHPLLFLSLIRAGGDNKTIPTASFLFIPTLEREPYLSPSRGIPKLSVLCCKLHLSNIIIHNGPFTPSPRRAANRRLHFNARRPAGRGGAAARRSTAPRGSTARPWPHQTWGLFNSAGCRFPIGMIIALKPFDTELNASMNVSIGCKSDLMT